MSGYAERPTSRPIWLLRELDKARRVAAAAMLAGLPIPDPAQHFLLLFLQRAGDEGRTPSQRELAAGLHLAPATVTASLNALERHGFILRIADPTDRRVKRVEITSAGRRLTEQSHQRMIRLEGIMFQGFSPDELRLLGDFFSRMSQNLNAVGSCAEEVD